MSKVVNPFPEPDTIDKDINEIVRNYIRDIFNKHGQIDFFTMMKYLENSKEEKNEKLSQIIAYYCSNVIINSSTMSNKEKQELIHGLYREIYFTNNTSNETINENDTL